jgi:HK97 family phage portal protein
VTFFRAAETRAVVSGSATYNPFENPSTPLASVGFDGIWSTNKNDAGQTVTPDTAAGVATFFRCISVLSTLVAASPIQVYRKQEDVTANHPLLDEANTDMTYTQFELWQLVMVYRLVWGNSFVFKKRGLISGNVIDLKPIHPDFVKVTVEQGQKVFYVKRMKSDGTPDNVAPAQRFTTNEIMHIPGLGYDGMQGHKVVDLMAQTLGTSMAADRLAAKFYSKGSQLGGIIKVKVPLASQNQAEGIKSRWNNVHAGVDNAGDVAVLDAETDYQNVTIPPDQLQFLESRRWSTTEIARWFGIPPHIVGDVEKSTSWGTGIEQQNLGLHSFTLDGHTIPIQQRVTREVVSTRGQRAKFNTDRLVRGNLSERYQALVTAAGGPFMSRTEARKIENLAPLDNKEYDELLPPQGIGPMDEAPQDQPEPKQGNSTQE